MQVSNIFQTFESIVWTDNVLGVWRGSQGTTARAGSTCVTETPARTLPLVKTEMGFIFVTVHQDSQDRTVTR